MDEETLTVLEASCVRDTDLARGDVKEVVSGRIVKGLYIVAALSIVPLTAWIYGTIPFSCSLRLWLFFPWVICIAALTILGHHS